jgi:hypothetical protein
MQRASDRPRAAPKAIFHADIPEFQALGLRSGQYNWSETGQNAQNS